MGELRRLFRTGEDLAVYTDPASSIPFFYSSVGGVTCFYSNLELCPFLDRSEFTLNLHFISTLMAYDKLQNGATGLNEVKELYGGQCLMARTPDAPPETLWDPRDFARDGLEPDPDSTAFLLREAVQQVVSAWGMSVPAPAVDLSGGLDSSIVLACLADSDAPAPHLAVHHVVESEDPSEAHFARATAAFLGADLAEVRFSPSRQMPDVTSHPASARPFRQFLSRDFNAQLSQATGGRERTYLTGQGGDHLFHAAETALGFQTICAGTERDQAYLLNLSTRRGSRTCLSGGCSGKLFPKRLGKYTQPRSLVPSQRGARPSTPPRSTSLTRSTPFLTGPRHQGDYHPESSTR